MTASAPFAKCSCRVCNGHIEFTPEYAGSLIMCPHCGMDTTLFIPLVPVAPKEREPIASAATTAATPTTLTKCKDCGKEVSINAEDCPTCGSYLRPVSEGAVIAIYFFTMGFPVVGFFGGIYLITKRQPGAGIGAMVWSLLVLVIWILIIRS